MTRRIVLGASRTLALYGFAGWVYIALVALVRPYTLGMQLTHFARFPHEDTFGEACFGASMVGFFVYSLLRSPERNTREQEPSGPLDLTGHRRAGPAK